jgi:naphthalene 1,2-dioxygenase system ferredoxin subunit
MTEKGKFVTAISVDEIPEGAVHRCVVGEQSLALYNVAGNIYATQDDCTHGLASLSDGYLEGEEIECPLHQGVFNVRTGEALSRPCQIPLKTYPVKIEEGLIHISVA